jgi:ATF/CREB family transcription factor
MNNNMGHMPVQMAQDTTPARRNTKGSINSISGSADTGDFSDSGHSEQAKPSTRSRGKKGGNTKSQAGGRRKADETPAKQGANKKQKANNGSARSQTAEEEDSDEDGSPKLELNENGKKMTDEEKRKNFLERNRYGFAPIDTAEPTELVPMYLLTVSQSCCIEVPSAQKAMAR